MFRIYYLFKSNQVTISMLQQKTQLIIINRKIAQIFQVEGKMIKQLKISHSTVFLEGMSLRGSFVISNPNQQLAISYQIEPAVRKKNTGIQNADTNVSMDSILSIFPKSGILLRGESQKITLKAKTREQFENQNFLDNCLKLNLKYSLDNNFNKILLKNKSTLPIKCDKLQNYLGFVTIQVEVGTDHLRIKSQIESQVLFSSSLGKQTANISMIGSKVKQTDEDFHEVCTIVNSLDLNSKVKQSFVESPIKKKDSDSIAEQQSLMVDLQKQQKSYELLKTEKQSQKSYLQLESAQQMEFSKSFQDFAAHLNKNKSHQQVKINTFELVLLAIMAGFFYSLGANLSLFLNN